MGISHGPDQFEPSDYLGVLLRRWWVWIGVTVLFVLGAVAYYKVAPRTYTATASVYVTPTAADQSNAVANSRTSGATVNLDTEAVVVQSAQVAQIVAKLLHSPLSLATLASQVTVTVPTNSQVLQIHCTAAKPGVAATCAQAFAQAYLQNRDTQSAQWINAQMAVLQTKIAALEKTASGLSSTIASLPSDSASRASAQTALSTDNSELSQLSSQVATLTSEAAANSGGSIITNAVPPAGNNPTEPNKKIVLASGLALGLVIGLVLAFVWDRRDKRIRGAHDVDRYLEVPAMLTVSDKSFAGRASVASPRSRYGQAFMELAHAVAIELGEGDHVVLVAGVSPGPVGSLVAANLAAGLARTRVSTVLVCADADSAAPQALLEKTDGPGLSDLLGGVAPLSAVRRKAAAVPGLTVVTPGTDAAVGAELLSFATADRVVSQLRGNARYIIIEVQATGEADTFMLADSADGALIVVEASRSTRAESLDAIRRLRLLRTPVLGAVVCPAGRRKRRGQETRQEQPQLDPALENGTGNVSSGPGRTKVSAGSAQNRTGLGRSAWSRADQDDPADTVDPS
jgi:capsular polysaccharide biosynthesis protein/Mrp family chromosome partitioning ATPase